MQKHGKEWTLLGVFIVLFILMGILSPDRFLSIDNLQSMAFQLPEFGIIALGMMVIIITGGINLSITATSALAGIISAFVLSSSMADGNIFITILASLVTAILVALLCGAINGLVVAYIGVSPILVTLGTMTLFEGISLNFTKGGAISGFPEQYYWFGNGNIAFIPVPMVIFAILAILTAVALERTEWGSKVYMVGCNPVATTFSGVNIKKVLMKVYLYSSLMAGIAAIIMNSRYNSAKVDYGSSYLLQSVAAVVLGGTNIEGGYGKVVGTVIAVAIIQIISSGLNILGINRYIVDITMGTILILVLTINFITTRYEKGKLNFNFKGLFKNVQESK
jgi:ribose/xylose/arabinose/galactoside ABC-type transport system permease subunit